ncbi:hypothetical protein EBB07_28610 [Paenibacillaceae bacterium]|nr:hypothetical protein EBB07_28610 [Paenibacillaceae bacterium]
MGSIFPNTWEELFDRKRYIKWYGMPLVIFLVMVMFAVYYLITIPFYTIKFTKKAFRRCFK